jgi:hypothetical protein
VGVLLLLVLVVEMMMIMIMTMMIILITLVGRYEMYKSLSINEVNLLFRQHEASNEIIVAV